MLATNIFAALEESEPLASASSGSLQPFPTPIVDATQEPQEEKRVARDGNAYTYQDFAEWYSSCGKTKKMWADATPVDADAILQIMRRWNEDAIDSDEDPE